MRVGKSTETSNENRMRDWMAGLNAPSSLDANEEAYHEYSYLKFWYPMA